jgi:uncharacterized cupin superfamily protein
MPQVTGPFVTHEAAAEWEPFALGELEIGEVHWLRSEESSDGAYYAGLWRIGPGEFPPEVPYDMTMNETIHIVEGEVQIEVVDGPTLELGPGSIASFAPGTRTRWRFQKAPFKELFILS